MSDSYVVRLERLRAELRDILRGKGKIIADNITLTDLINMVDGLSVNGAIASLLSNSQPTFELVDTDGVITTIKADGLKGSKVSKIVLPYLTDSYSGCFQNCTSATEISVGSADITTEVRTGFIRGCTSLVTANFGDIYIPESGTYHFAECTNLKIIKFNKFLRIQGGSHFLGNTSLKIVDFGTTEDLSSPNTNSFNNCSSIKAIVLRNTTMVTSRTASMFDWLKNGATDWYIYVPDALVTTYQADSVWSNYNFKPLSEYDENAILNG